MINIPKGTKDVLPNQSYKWQYIEDAAREVARAFNLKEVRTPVFEHTELFQRGVGETTDVVNKEMYTFEDKGGRSITLKPEGHRGGRENVYRKRACKLAYARQNLLYNPCFPLRKTAGGQTSRVSPVRHRSVRLTLSRNGRRSDFRRFVLFGQA